MYNFVCPIYWTKTFKTKNSETHLIGMNYYRNAVYYDQNKLKQEVEDQLKQSYASIFIPVTTPLNSGNTELFNANLLTLKEHEREITSIWEL